MTVQPDDGSLDESAALAAELKALRKGRGLSGTALDRSPQLRLRELAGEGEPTDRGRLRRVLTAELTVLAARLPEELRTAIHASLGLTAETRDLTFHGDRVAWLAARIKRDPRTALRRIDDAERLLAEEIAAELRRRRARPAGPGADEWYTAKLSTRLLLDGDQPEAIERRRIVSTSADLSEISLTVDVPPREPAGDRVQLALEVLSGGTLIRRESPSASRTGYAILLPKPLQPGEEHEFELSVRVSSRTQMRPYYALTPERRCDQFELRVRFDRRRPPAWVRRIEGEPVRVFEVLRPGGVTVPVDAAGEAHQSFQSLALHVGYGMQWLTEP